MGGFLDKPKTEKYNEHGEGNGLIYGLASMQGWRIEMEDAHCAVLGLPHGLKDWSFFAVFDGHAGAGVSGLCAENLLESITQCEDFRTSVEKKSAKEVNGTGKDQSNVYIGKIKLAIREGFLQLDEKMRALPEVTSGQDKSGSTAVCCLISPTHLFIANCGDSRAVLSRNNQAYFSTQDHKPIMPAEKERIQNAGGSVMIERVNGSLAVSRALGDYEYKQVEGKGQCEQLVSPEPEIIVQERDHEKDEFIVFACDGIWDVMSNEELCDFIRSRLRITNNLESICNQVIDTCLYKQILNEEINPTLDIEETVTEMLTAGSKDNMSIVLVIFPGVPSVSPVAIEKEKELENTIEEKVKEIVLSDPKTELLQVLSILENEDLSNLPPGGGIRSKRPLIERVYYKLKPPVEDNADNAICAAPVSTIAAKPLLLTFMSITKEELLFTLAENWGDLTTIDILVYRELRTGVSSIQAS
ncbi:Protein phosphatase 1B [Nymphon striatum]|nr:Protein phosphatase 1B [Nymphon striatum]